MKEYYIDEKSIRYCYPYETKKKVTDYGVLAKYIGKRFSEREIDKIISENPNEIHTYIKKMYISYSDDNQNGIKYADWQFEKGVN